MTVRFVGRHAGMYLVICYTPTLNATQVSKDDFYGSLKAVIKDIAHHDMTLIVRDLSANVGSYWL